MSKNLLLLGLAVFVSAATTTTLAACNESQVSLYLYTETTGKSKPCKLTSSSCPDWKTCGFDPLARTVIIIHGWAGRYDGPCPLVIKDAYIERGVKANVIVVDYGPCSADYALAVSYSKQIGQEYVAKVIIFLADYCGLNLKVVECVGHSLGAHICGLCSAALPVKFKRIAAMDAARPTIEAYSNDGRLDKTDSYVVCYHTSDKLLAIKYPFCHCDFYPNGGKAQVGCVPAPILEMLTGGCSHNKACEIFALSVLYPTMFPIHKQCDTYEQAAASSCTKPPPVGYMGDPTDGLHGIFYVNSTDCYKKMNML